MSSIPPSKPQGYTINLVKPLTDAYKCPYCDKLMRDPIQTIYGERSCQDCYITVIGTEALDSTQVFNDRLAQREINNLECYCNNRNHGCQWIGVVQDIDDHTRQCVYQHVTCKLCSEEVVLFKLSEHLEESCIFREIKCSYCDETISASRKNVHEENCLKKSSECVYGCGEHMLPEELLSHSLKCEMLRNGKICPLSIIGCETVTASQNEQLEHVNYAVVDHCKYIISKLDVIDKKSLVLNEKMDLVDRRLIDLENNYLNVCKERDQMMNELEMYKNNFHMLETSYDAYKKEMESRISQLEKIAKFTDDSSNVEEALRTTKEKIANIEQQLNELTEAIHGHPSQDSSGLSTLSAVKGIESKVKGIVKQVDMVERQHAMMSATLSDLDLKVQILESSSYDGHQIWRIDNIRLRTTNAITGKLTAIHSPPCFTKRGGYKFCTRLYLNGDGMGKGTHISVFFVLMKSDFDDLNQWPFQHRVSFKLLNPKDEKLSHKESFVPDRNSSSFRKPARDMNVAAGCPMFVRLERLHSQGFVIDDALFLETTVVPM